VEADAVLERDGAGKEMVVIVPVVMGMAVIVMMLMVILMVMVVIMVVVMHTNLSDILNGYLSDKSFVIQ
jgi:hypothetical protein